MTTTARRGFLRGLATLPLAAMPTAAKSNTVLDLPPDIPAILAELRHLSTIVDTQREKVRATDPGMQSAYDYLPDGLRPVLNDKDHFGFRPGFRGWQQHLVWKLEEMEGLTPEAATRRDQILAGERERQAYIRAYAEESGREAAIKRENAAVDRADALIESLLDLGPAHAGVQAEALLAFNGEGWAEATDPLLLRFLMSFRNAA